MQCLLCGKKISRLRVWKTKSEFCRDEHADTYKKQTLDRLLRDQEQLLHKVSAPPLPISDDLTDGRLDTVFARGNEAEGLDRSHLLAAPEPAGANLDAVGVELSDTQPAESLDDIFSPGQQREIPDDVRQQKPEDALEALRRLAEHSPARPPDIASDVTGADLEFGGSEAVEKEQASGGTASMLDRLMGPAPADEPSQALQMPPIGKRLELDDAPSAGGSSGSESDAGGIDSPAAARAAESPAAQSEADPPSESEIPVWLREFTAETSGTKDRVAQGLADEESYEPDPVDVRFSEIEALEEPSENPDLDSQAFGPGEEADHENRADRSPSDALKRAGGVSDALHSGAPEAAHSDAAEKTPEARDQTHPEGDIKLPESAAAESTGPGDELEPRDLDVDPVAAAEESPATAGEGHEALESLPDGLAGTAEDGGESYDGGSSVASGEAHAGPPMRNVVRFPDPDELPQFKAASSQELAEKNEPRPDGEWAPWLEMMGVELSAQEPAELDAPGQDPETAGGITPNAAPHFSPSAIATISLAGLPVWDAIGTKAEMMPVTLRPSEHVPQGFLGQQADLLPGGIGKHAGLPLGGPRAAAFTFRFISSVELTPAGSPRLNSEIQEFAPDQSGSTTPLVADTAICRARPTPRAISLSARLAAVEGLLAAEPRIADSVENELLRQAEVAVPILDLQSPNRVAARTPLKPIASARRPEIFEALWLPVPQLLDLAEQPADRMHQDLIRSKVECRLSFLADIRYGLAVGGCQMPPNRLLRCFWPAWTDDLPQQPVAYEVRSPSIEPRSAPHMPEPVYRGIGGGRATFPRVETLLMATGADEWATSPMAWQPNVDLDSLKAELAHTDKPLDDYGGKVRDWRAEPIGPLLALHGPENLDPCEYV